MFALCEINLRTAHLAHWWKFVYGCCPANNGIENKKQLFYGTAFLSRDDWIRTSGLFVPNEARYRAALHPELSILIKIKR